MGIKGPHLYALFKRGLKSTLLKEPGKKRGLRLIKRSDIDAYLAERVCE